MTTVLCRQEDAVRELLGIPPSFAVAGLIAIGHPVRQIHRLRRQPIEEFTFLDRFGEGAEPARDAILLSAQRLRQEIATGRAVERCV